MTNLTPPLELLRRAACELGPLCDEVVFVGGAVLGLLLTEELPEEDRFTEDVDFIVNVSTRADYYAFTDRLLNQGFQHDIYGPVCRFKKQGLIVDAVPVEPAVIGFSNAWYAEGYAKAGLISITNEFRIKILFAPAYLASKLEAFSSPTREFAGDMLASRDFEDIVTLINRRVELQNEFKQSSPELKEYLVSALVKLLDSRDLEEGVSACLPSTMAGQQRRPLIISRIKNLAAMQ